MSPREASISSSSVSVTESGAKGFVEFPVVSHDGFDLGRLLARQHHDLFAFADDAGSDGAAETAEVEIGSVDELHRHAKVLQVAIAADVNRFQEVHQRAAVVPRHGFAAFDDVVSVERADRIEVQVRQIQPRRKSTVVIADGFVLFLIKVDEVHLVDRDDDVLDAQQRHDEGVTLGLRQNAFSGIDHQNREVRRRRAGSHVPRVLLVARRVGDDELSLGRAEVAVGDIDRDALLPFLFQSIHKQRRVKITAGRSLLSGVALDFRQLVFVDQFGIVEQSTDQGALAVVHAPAGDKAKQLLVLVLLEVGVDVGRDQV